MTNEKIVQYDELPVRVGPLRDFAGVLPGIVVSIPANHKVFYERTPISGSAPYAKLLASHLRNQAADRGLTLLHWRDPKTMDYMVSFTEKIIM
jgi:hypothetical protein